MAIQKSTVKHHHVGAGRAVEAHPTSASLWQGELEGHIRGLTLAMNVVMVCTAALREQNAELDFQVAEVLRHCVSDRLWAAIEKLESAKGRQR